MRDGRTIIIKDPWLQKIRNNLRLIILKERIKRQMEISDKNFGYHEDWIPKIVGENAEKLLHL